ncbi:MAG TPA: MFS transporter [Candidatus Binatia bacterium]|nr:MFS transporter [Candidatus Binatia bacterium]
MRRILSPYHPALTHPVLRRVLAGVALSALGDGMSAVAIAWLALRLSHSAVLVGASLAAYSLPGALGAAVLGRWMRGRSGARLALANAVVRATALGLAAALALAGLLHPWWYVCLLGISSLLSAWGLAGRYTLIADALPPADRIAGNTVFGVLDQASLMIGPALAGVVSVLAGPAVAIAADAGSWAVLAISYARVIPLVAASRPPSPSALPTSPSASAPGGAWSVIRADRTLLGLILLSFVFYLLYGPVEVALPFHVAVDLHGSASLLGTFWAVFGVGAVTGELAVPFVRRRWPVWPTMTAIVLGWGLALVPLGLPAPLWVALPAFCAGAVIWGPWTSLSMAIFQDASPPSALAPLLAARGSLLIIASPLGTALGGPLVAALGARGTLLASALVTIVLGGAAVFLDPSRQPMVLEPGRLG